ncbi:MAG: YceD family protein [Gammaproteobacteria bacterium]|nr:YceD family protein [Gammaproteobacteria bacterium]
MDKNYILPTHIDPYRYAENAGRLQGRLQLKDMDRLTPSLLESDGEVAIDVVFGIDPQGIKYLKGSFETKVTLQCQRCLEPFSLAIHDHLSSGLVRSEEAAKKLPDHYEPLIVKDDELVINDMIEDELILSLPIVPMHDASDCRVKLPVIAAEVESAVGGAKVNPFKIIESLKSKNKE